VTSGSSLYVGLSAVCDRLRLETALQVEVQPVAHSGTGYGKIIVVIVGLH
jgi:hypothetical protein